MSSNDLYFASVHDRHRLAADALHRRLDVRRLMNLHERLLTLHSKERGCGVTSIFFYPVGQHGGLKLAPSPQSWQSP